MKYLTFTIVVNLVLSSSTTVLCMPHALEGIRSSLATRSMGQQVRHSLLGGRLMETSFGGLLKRENVQKEESEEDGHDDYSDDDGDDDEDSCDYSSDSSDAEHQNTPNLHTPYKIGLNSTTKPSTKPKPSSQNSSYSSTENSAKPTNPVGSPPPSNYHSTDRVKHQIDAQKYEVDNYASQTGKRHGFVGPYNGYQGKATFFSQGGAAGACGKVHQDSDYVVAIQSQMYGGGKFCGKTVLVTRKSTGKSIKCVAADECPGCPTDQSLDLSIAAFNALGSPDEGVFDIHWQVMD